MREVSRLSRYLAGERAEAPKTALIDFLMAKNRRWKGLKLELCSPSVAG